MKFFTVPLLLLALLIATSCHKKTAFELEHDKAVAENPAAVEMHIATANGQTKFHVNQPILIEEFYTAEYPAMWHMEVDTNNSVPNGMIHIDNGSKSSAIPFDFGESDSAELLRFGIACCFSRHIWLSLDPTRMPYLHSSSPRLFYAFTAPTPGTYQIYASSQRVFSRDQARITYSGSGNTVTSSNTLKITVTQ